MLAVSPAKVDAAPCSRWRYSRAGRRTHLRCPITTLLLMWACLRSRGDNPTAHACAHRSAVRSRAVPAMAMARRAPHCLHGWQVSSKPTAWGAPSETRPGCNVSYLPVNSKIGRGALLGSHPSHSSCRLLSGTSSLCMPPLRFLSTPHELVKAVCGWRCGYEPVSLTPATAPGSWS